MGQIRGFFRSDFSAFGAPAPNALKSDLKKSRICPIWGQCDHFGAKPNIPGVNGVHSVAEITVAVTGAQ